MRILAMSDIHCRFEEFAPENLPEADLCLVAGDLTNEGKRGEWRLTVPDFYHLFPALTGGMNLAAWQTFETRSARKWLTALAAKYPVFWIPGNHDIGVDNEGFGEIPNCTGIMDRTVEFGGLRIHGVSLAPSDSPFLAETWDYMTMDPEAERAAFDFAPVDIVVSHSPPYQCVDGGVLLLGGRRVHFGSCPLREYIERQTPRLVLCGHIHEAQGEETIGPTLICNVAETWKIIDLATP